MIWNLAYFDQLYILSPTGDLRAERGTSPSSRPSTSRPPCVLAAATGRDDLAGTIGPGNVLYQGTISGLFRIARRPGA
jgi:hypothetical protein